MSVHACNSSTREVEGIRLHSKFKASLSQQLPYLHPTSQKEIESFTRAMGKLIQRHVGNWSEPIYCRFRVQRFKRLGFELPGALPSHLGRCFSASVAQIPRGSYWCGLIWPGNSLSLWQSMVLSKQYWFFRHAKYRSDEGPVGFHPDYKAGNEWQG